MTPLKLNLLFSIYSRLTLRMSVRLLACSIHLLARLYFLYSARLTFGSLCSKLCSVFLSAALAQTLLFYLCLYFLFVFYLSLFYFCALAALRCLCAMSALTLRMRSARRASVRSAGCEALCAEQSADTPRPQRCRGAKRPRQRHG